MTIYEVIFDSRFDEGYHKVVRGIIGFYGALDEVDGIFLFEPTLERDNKKLEAILLGIRRYVPGVRINRLDSIN